MTRQEKLKLYYYGEPMQIPFVDLKAQYQSIKDEIDTAIQQVINDTAFIGGKYVKKFEEEFAAFIGTEYCIGCANGTDALQITLKALGIGQGDEVIVPANSFIATSEAVTAAGAQVVFCDVDNETNNLNPALLEQKVTAHTKAVIAVHLYGHPADVDAIVEIARIHNLKIIEDAAQAHGAVYKGRKIGTLADAACFSFYPGKNLGAYGDGGAMVTNDQNLAKKMRMWANHGRLEKYNHEFEAYNSRLDGLQAAILSVKLNYLENWTKQRREIASFYTKELAAISDIILPAEENSVESVYHLYVIKTRQRDQLQKYLKDRGIASGIHYPIGLPFLKAYEYLGHKPDDFPVTASNQHKLLSLPMFAELSEEQRAYIVKHIKKFFQ